MRENQPKNIEALQFQARYPYRFNPWKHHLHWVSSLIEQAITSPKNKVHQEIITNIKFINSNHVDIYTGQLSPEEIIWTIDLELQNLQALNKPNFQAWLNKREYQLLTLTDSSVWVIREGIADDRYIHFHPARNSPNTIRVHGNSWKTAIVVKLIYLNLSDITLDKVNEIRESILDLSPIKDLEGSLRLKKAFELIGNWQ